MLEKGWTPEMIDRMERQDKKAAELIAADPSLPHISAYIIAGDLVGAELMSERVKAGEWTPEKALVFVGSYARFEWALDNMGEEYVHKHIADLWRGSDPDDTNKRFLEVWQNAAQNKGTYIRDGEALPRDNPLTIYRGQKASDPLGIAWTTDIEIAKKFAKGAGIRVKSLKGSVLQAHVWRGLVLGYLTKRGESEVVVNPSDLVDVQEIGYFGEKREDG
jgi:hypothetical protein